MELASKEADGEFDFEGKKPKVSKDLEELVEKLADGVRIRVHFAPETREEVFHLVCEAQDDVVGVQHKVLLQTALLVL